LQTNDKKKKPPLPVLLGLGLGLFALLALALWPTSPPPGPPPPPPSPEEVFLDLPKIDVHTHLSLSQVPEILGIMDENGIDVMLNASGGGPNRGLPSWARVAAETGGRIRPYCNFPFSAVEQPEFPELAVAWLNDCKSMGAVGLKVFKSLGLGIPLSDGSLLRADDPRLDLVFETAGNLGLPVLIHTGDPQAFFEPPTRDNERYAELEAHPSWSFYGDDPAGNAWPTWEEIFAQFEERVARNPGTTFVGAHFGNAPEEPQRVARMLERYPNLVVEIGARVPEIGRHDAGEMRALFVRFADRILFGTDLAVTDGGLTLGSSGPEEDRRDQVPAFFASHFRYLETARRGFAHPTPIQGNWTIDGLSLPREVLQKVYADNARQVFRLELPSN